MPILKYEISKNVRVCQMCYDVLTMGSENTIKTSSIANLINSSLPKSNSNNTFF